MRKDKKSKQSKYSHGTRSFFGFICIAFFMLAGCYGSNGAKDEEESQGKIGGQSGGDIFGGDFNPDIAKVGGFNGNSFAAAADPEITITDQSLLEGNSGVNAFLFTLTYTPGTSFAVMALPGAQVDYATEDDTATEGQDYFVTSGTLTFAQGEWSKVIEVPVVGDTDVEGDESFILKLSNPQGATLPSDQAIGTIVDDDSPILLPVISLTDSSMTESDADDQNMLFNVSLHRTSLDPVSVDYWTLDGSATAGNDYQASSGTLDFAPGEDQKEIAIPLKGDLDPEHEEYFHLTLGNPVNAYIQDAAAEGKIKDNDSTNPQTSQHLKVSDRNVPEGDAGPLKIALTVTLGSPLSVTPVNDLKLDLTSSQSTALSNQRSFVQTNSEEVSLDYRTEDGSATAGVDYESTSGSLRFAPGEKSKTIELVILGDTLQEGDESFMLRFTNVVGAPMKKTNVAITILDDDGTNTRFPTIGFSEKEGIVSETKVGFSRPGDLIPKALYVVLDKPSVETVSVEYITVNGKATHPDDYEGASGILTFAPGEVRKAIEVKILNDKEEEGDESFDIQLKNPINGRLGQERLTLSIVDDEAFYKNKQEEIIQVSFADDLWIREAEDGATRNATFKLSVLRNYLPQDWKFSEMSVEYYTVDGSAKAGHDYQDTSGVFTFTPSAWGTNDLNITVPIYGNSIQEDDRTFFLKLRNPSSTGSNKVEIVLDTSLCIIGDDDAPAAAPSARLTQVQSRVIEGDQSHNQAKSLSFRVSFIGGLVPLSAYGLQTEGSSLRVEGVSPWGSGINFGPNSYGDQPLSIDYATVDGTASAGSDYQSVSGTFTYDPKDSQALPFQLVEIPVTPDLDREADERFMVQLSNPVNVELSSDKSGTFTITDDDSPQEALDFNGDGINDLLTGTAQKVERETYPDPHTKIIESTPGLIHMFFGEDQFSGDVNQGSRVSRQPDVILKGTDDKAMFGHNFGPVGDVNGDGFDDFMVSAPGHNNHAGAVYIFYGFSGATNSPRQTTSVELTPDQADVILLGSSPKKIVKEMKDGEEVTRITGGDHFGFSVSSAGDFDGDGLDDIIVGAPMRFDGWGAAYIFKGSSFPAVGKNGKSNDLLLAQNSLPNTFEAEKDAALILHGDGLKQEFLYRALVKGHRTNFDFGNFLGVGELFGGDQGEGFAHSTSSPYRSRGQFGYSVSCVRDFNGDGYDDVVVGQPRLAVDEFWDNGGVSGAYLFLGGPLTYSRRLNETDAEVAFLGVGGFGTAVSGIGDFNNDGFGDLAISGPTKWRVASGDDDDASLHGAVWIYAGREIDPHHTLIGNKPAREMTTTIGSLSGGEAFYDVGRVLWDVEWNGTDEDYHLYQIRARSLNHHMILGELNADWFFSRKDLGSGGSVTDEGQYYPKFSELMAGQSSGSKAWRNVPMMYKHAPALNGWSLCHAGDFDADGFDDLFIGCPGWGAKHGGNDARDQGAGFIAFGREDRKGLDYKALRTHRLSNGINFSRFGSSAACYGDIDGDGVDDILIGTKPVPATNIPLVEWDVGPKKPEDIHPRSFGHLRKSTIDKNKAMTYLFPGNKDASVEPAPSSAFKGFGYSVR